MTTPQFLAGTIEEEFGVPIPGTILPRERWVQTAIKRWPGPGPLDFTALFGRTAPLIVELGCGNARYTLQSAIDRPECDHFASDLLPVVIRYATRRANQRGLSNTRFAVKDAQTVVRDALRPGSVAELHLYHPQPYHDPREAHLRLVTPRFLADVHRALIASGLFVVQTDNPEYWDYLRSVLPRFFQFQEHPEPWQDAPLGRSRREILARRRGLTISRAVCRRKDDLDADARAALVRNLPLPTFHTRHSASRDLDEIERRGEP